jgi:hypothetical protein
VPPELAARSTRSKSGSKRTWSSSAAGSGTQGVQAITEAAFELMGNGREGFGCDLEVEAPTHLVWIRVGWEAIR